MKNFSKIIILFKFAILGPDQAFLGFLGDFLVKKPLIEIAVAVPRAILVALRQESNSEIKNGLR